MAASIVLYSYEWNLLKLQYLLIKQTLEAEFFNIASDQENLSHEAKKIALGFRIMHN